MYWLLGNLSDRGIAAPRRAAYTYTTRPDAMPTLRTELQLAQGLGVPVTWTTETDLPFTVAGAIRLEDQAQINAVDAVRVLAAELRELGGSASRARG